MNTEFDDVFFQIKSKISDNNQESYIPDIIEFCNSKRYLNLQAQGVELYSMQKIILKSFYRGQKGNEHVKLDDEELALLNKNNMTSVIDKYQSGDLFRELVLILGRRSGKDFMCSLIALYEAMKLLEVPGGSIHPYYPIAPGNPSYILTIANSSDQARILFNEIKTKLQTSEYFRNKIGSVEADRISLLTPGDKKQNREAIESNFHGGTTKGSVVIMSGHSNSDSLLGKKYFALLFDEVASYKTTGSSASGDQLYNKLGPGTVDFARTVGYKEDGTPIKQLDSKIISISSPRAEEGILFRLFNDAPLVKNRLVFKLPTWKVNLALNEDMLRAENRYMPTAEFQMEFGSEFAGSGGEKFIENKYIDEAILLGTELKTDQKISGRPGIVYYAHLDPATTSHNYALVVVHVEEKIYITVDDYGNKTRNRTKFFIVDHVMMWQPTPGNAINVKKVDDYIIDLAKHFRLGMVSYDNYNSFASMQKMRAAGIPCKITPFRRAFKMVIYDHLEQLFINNQLALQYKGPYSQQMEMELKCLKKVFSTQGYQIKPDPEGQVATDDICDALAAACHQAIETNYAGYPKGVTVNMPHIKEGTQWNIGRGVFTSENWKLLNQKFKT